MLWQVLAVPYAAAAVLLVVAGAPKVLDPGDLHRAVRSVGMPVGREAVRAFALAEVVVGVAALAVPGPATALLLAALYAGFTAFVVVALRSGGVVSSCGCFGKADTPPTVAHAVLTGGAALAGLAAAAVVPAAPWAGLEAGQAAGVLALVSLVAFLAWQVMAALPSVDPRAVRSVGRG
ncbi:MauE/DoxX family redox-associated membrane protein [Oryzobacter sp. R7]|uniref:MauE/DoxX family redox-associated membrane protein n=1 Tax=Oryzobacter faecalis TaxID=3388656 RepID=UPI00398D1FDB